MLQQRTLRELRAAIKPIPEPSPKIFLPDRFKKTTTELPDGTVVVVDDDNEKPGIEVRLTSAGTPAEQKPISKRKSSANNSPGEGRYNKRSGARQKDDKDTSEQSMSRAERRRRIKQDLMKAAPKEGEMKGTRYVRRRLW